jgi:hypothetical protein
VDDASGRLKRRLTSLRNSERKIDGRKRALAFVIIVTAIKLGIVWVGWSETTLITDDAYYYFTIARHIVHGLGPTFDGIAPTNGFHPLWLLLLLPLFATAPDSMWIPIRIALSVNVLLDTLTAVLLFRILDRHVGRRSASLAAVICLCAPTNAILAFTGMEASLVTFLVVVLLQSLVDEDRRVRTPSRHALVTGLLWGLCGLARTDEVFIAFVAIMAVVAQRPGGWRKQVRWLAPAAATASVVLAPWFIWNQTTFGTLEQVSSQAKRLAKVLWGILPNDWSSPLAVMTTATTYLFTPVIVMAKWLCVEDLTHPTSRWTLSLAWLLLGPGLWVAFRGARVMRAKGAGPLLAFAAAFLTAHTVLYGFVLRFYAPWYAGPYFAVIAMFVAVGLSVDVRPTSGRMLLAGAALPMVASQLTLLLLFARNADHGKRGAERRWSQQFARILRRSPAGARVGLFDAGAAGYVSGWYPGIHIVNLDGLVNNQAIAALKQGRYPEYVVENVQFIQSVRRTKMFLNDSEYDRLLRLLRERGLSADSLR